MGSRRDRRRGLCNTSAYVLVSSVSCVFLLLLKIVEIAYLGGNSGLAMFGAGKEAPRLAEGGLTHGQPQAQFDLSRERASTFTQLVAREERNAREREAAQLDNRRREEAYVTIIDPGMGVREAAVVMIDFVKQIRARDEYRDIVVLLSKAHAAAPSLEIIITEQREREVGPSGIHLRYLEEMAQAARGELRHVEDFVGQSESALLDVQMTNPKLHLWTLYEYRVVAYLDPKMQISGNVSAVFDACSHENMCARAIYPDESEMEPSGTRLFHPGLMVVKPRPLQLSSLLGGALRGVRLVGETYDKFLDAMLRSQHAFLVLMVRDDWGALPSDEYNFIRKLDQTILPEKVKTHVDFKVRMKIITGYFPSGRGGETEEEVKEAERVKKLTAIPTKMYCEWKGIDFEQYTEPVLPSENFTSHWNRYALIRSELDRYDYVMWLDADAYVNDFRADIRDVIQMYSSDVIVGVDWDTAAQDIQRPYPPINMGVTVFRASEWTRQFLDYFLSNEDSYCRQCARDRCPAKPYYHDQGCFEHLYMNDTLGMQSRVEVVPMGLLQRPFFPAQRRDILDHFNSRYSFIMHAAGIRREVREDLLDYALTKLLREGIVLTGEGRAMPSPNADRRRMESSKLSVTGLVVKKIVKRFLHRSRRMIGF